MTSTTRREGDEYIKLLAEALSNDTLARLLNMKGLYAAAGEVIEDRLKEIEGREEIR